MQSALVYKIVWLLAAALLPYAAAGDNGGWHDSPAEYWREIATLRGKEKTKALRRLAIHYINTEQYRPDSSLHYAERAFQASTADGDLRGAAVAAEICGNVALQLSQVRKGEHYYRLCKQLSQTVGDANLEATANRGLGHALWYGGRFVLAVDTMLLALQQFEKLGARQYSSDAIMVISSICSDMGNYERAFEIAQQSLARSRELKDVRNEILSLVQLGYLYRNVGDYETAMDYFKKAIACKPPFQEWCYRHLCNRIGDLYTNKKNFDSAYYFYSQSLSSHAESKTSLLRMADYWLAREDYKKAETYFQKVYRQLRNTGEGNLFVFSLIGLGKTALANKAFTKALVCGREALQHASPVEARLALRDAYQLLYTTFDSLKQADSAYFYYKKYEAKKDAIVSDQFKGKLYAYKQGSQLRLLANEKLLAEQQVKSNRLQRNFLLCGLGLLLLFGFIVFRNVTLKRRNESLKAGQVQWALKQQAAEMEMQALRAQMNPHFIFNALSSINRFILKNDPDKASDYLTRFSRLIRLVLINSQRELVSLEEELETLRLYLQMEQLRFREAFVVDIQLDESLEPGALLLPPMLLQPFCENAIWHGLMHRERGGRLSLCFYPDNGALRCTITDNGIGRQRAAALASKTAEKIKSLGMQLTHHRLALFNEDWSKAAYEVEDLLDENGCVAGTRVNLRIRCTAPTKHQKTVVC